MSHLLAQWRNQATFSASELKQFYAEQPPTSQSFGAWLDTQITTGVLVRYRSGRFGLVAQPTHEGTLSAHPKGFGFIAPDTPIPGQPDSFYVSAASMSLLLTGDRARFHIVSFPGGKSIAELFDISRPDTFWLGTMGWLGLTPVLVPDLPTQVSITLPRDLPVDNVSDVILVKVPGGTPLEAAVRGEYVRNLGPRTAQGFETRYAIAASQLPFEFSAETLAAANAFLATSPGLTPGRLDWQHLPFVTIDGESTRDFDDAIQVDVTEDGYCLRVAVADVAYYVEPHTMLDTEALARGTSVYFPDQVVPMLPEALSNGMCSLIQGAPRYALACEMSIDTCGNVLSFAFCRVLIKCAARLTYNQVAHFARGEEQVVPEAVREGLRTLIELSAALELSRTDASLKLSSKEPKLVTQPDGQLNLSWFVPTEAHRYVELCMLQANTCAARFLHAHGKQALFRYHAAPSAEDWAAARAALQERGLSLAEAPSLREISDMLEATRSRPDEAQIENVLLKTLPAAVYDAERASHFSLDVAYYAHFTSPIRRYPDLLVHRAILAQLTGSPEFATPTVELAAHCSQRASRAQKAANSVWTRLKRRFISQQCIGHESSAKVVKAAPKGYKVFLLEWQTMAWMPLSLAGPSNLEEGARIQVRVKNATEVEVEVAYQSAGLAVDEPAPAAPPAPRKEIPTLGLWLDKSARTEAWDLRKPNREGTLEA